MMTLKEYFDHSVVQEKNLLNKCSNDIPHLSMVLRSKNIAFALYSFFEEHNLQKAKQYFYVCGLLDAFRIKNYQDRMFDYNIASIGYAMLSDNLLFVKEVYANLTYNTFYLEDKTKREIPLSMDEMVEDGEGTIFVHTVQQFLKGNNELTERNLSIMENKYLPKKKQRQELARCEVDFFKALFQKDKAGCEKSLQEMVSPKIHNRTNYHEILLKKYISMPALCYAKLAWICGVEVEIKSKLIPKELLPVQPNERYEIPYDFLP